MGDHRDNSTFEEDGKLKLPDRFQALKIGEEEYKLVSLYESLRFRAGSQAGEVLDLILPKLRQGCEFDEILKTVDPQRQPLVLDILKDLADRGLLQSGDFPSWGQDASQAEQDAYAGQMRFFANFRQLGEAPPASGSLEASEAALTHQSKLKESRVLVVGLGRIGSRLVRGLAQAGVGQIYGSDPAALSPDETLDSGYDPGDVGESGEAVLEKSIPAVNPHIQYSPLNGGLLFEGGAQELPAGLDLLVLCEDRFSPDHFEAANRICLEQGVTWLSYRSFGHRFEVGPLIVPHETACYHCMEMRRSSNNPSYEDLMKTQRSLYAQGANLGALNITTGYELLAVEVIKALTSFSRPLTYGSVYTFDLITFEGKLHQVLKVPRCPVCGSPSRERPSVRIWNLNELLD